MKEGKKSIKKFGPKIGNSDHSATDAGQNYVALQK